MIFGHAPVIFPGVLGVAIPFRRVFYAHLALLHAGLVLRIAGDLGGDYALARRGGLLNATAITLFLVATIASAVLQQAPAGDRVGPRDETRRRGRPLTDESAELLHELRVLCARLPVPQPTWHPYVPLIRACREDFEHALALAAERPEVLERAAALVEEESEPTLDPGASPELAAAYERLRALPDPDGQHPFLDEILPALEAMRVLLVALSQVAAA